MEEETKADVGEVIVPDLKVVSTEKKKWKLKNPVKMYIEYRTKKRLERERILLLREEQMNEDLERFLMEIEERRCWSAYQLNNINYQRMVKKESIMNMERKIREKERIEQEKNMKEDGLFFFQGHVQSYKRWQFSPAKHIDFNGHRGPVVSCKLSPSLNFMLSCSEDKTLRLWNMTTGDCLKTLAGHAKVVNDGDFHPNFKMYSKDPCIISASGDSTLRIWNSSDVFPMVTIFGHDKAVYRAIFAPDGKSFISCSEDKTIRTWCFPEGYNLFVYRAHTSPVISVSYSNSGRFFVSGSDYGERKILLWDAKLPSLKGPSQFPHVLFWTPEGLIRKILIKKTIPPNGFWLQQGELGLVQNEDQFDIWVGEMSDDERMEEEEAEQKPPPGESDSEEDGAESPEKLKASAYEQLIKNDLREYKGVRLSLTCVSPQGEKLAAREYNPGGYVYLKVQSLELPVGEAFISVLQKDSITDIFSDKSGRRIGNFQLTAPIPWLPTVMGVDSHGKPKPYREVPPEFSTSSDNYSIMFREALEEDESKQHMGKKKDIEEKETERVAGVGDISETEFELAWHCPEPNLGNIVIVVNFKFRDSNEWHHLRYSLNESPIRIMAGLSGGKAENEHTSTGESFAFDQCERHRLLCQYIREKDWKTVAALFEKKSIAFVSDRIIRKRFKIINMLIELFDDTTWFILHTPMIFKPGVTKSVMLCDVSYKSIEEIDGLFGPPLSDGENEDGDDNEGVDNDENPVAVPEQSENAKKELTIQILSESNPVASVAMNNENDADEVTSSLSGGEDITSPRNEILSDMQSPRSPENANMLNSPMTEVSPLNEAEEIKNEEGENVNKEGSNADDSENVMDDEDLARRLVAKPLNFPAIIITGKIDGDIFEKAVDSIAERETERLILAEERQLEIGKELGISTVNTSFLQQIKEASPSVGWLQAIDIFAIMRGLDQAQTQKKEKMWKAFKKEDEDWLELNTTTMKNPFIKTSKYGAEIEEFSMPLPINFPIRAGQARFALEPPIKRYEDVLRKRSVVALPTTLEEVYEPTMQERITEYYRKITKYEQKRYRKQILQVFKQYYALKLVEEKAYVSRRRQSYLSLPGLKSHYPNPHYTTPAIIPKSTDFQRKPPPPTLNFFDKLFGKTVLQTNVVPPVGRKPTPKQIIKIQQMLQSLQSNDAHAVGMKSVEDKYQTKNEDEENDPKEDLTIPMTPATPSIEKQPEKKSVEPVNVKKSNGGNLTKDGYPYGVYLGRRSYYPSLPGLEEFIENNNSSNNQDDKVKRDEEQFEGLVRRFRFNGFELAHHGAVNDIVFSPSETRVATAGGDSLIKIWDPRDGSYVGRLAGHQNGVMSLKYTSTEQFLISCGGDSQIIIWSLLSNSIQRSLRGHVDVVYRIAISPDCSLLVSASHDQTLKSWYTTPREPDPPLPPRIIKITDTTVLITWNAPPCFNCDVSAFHYQYRVGTKGEWVPPIIGQSIAPHLRNRVVEGLIPATHYQFRVQAENIMGRGRWSIPSLMIRTEFGLPKKPPHPLVCRIAKTYLMIGWFTPNPKTYGSASTSFEVQYNGGGKSFEDNPTKTIVLENATKLGENILDAFQKIQNRYEATKDSLIKSKGYNIQNRQSPEEAEHFPISDVLSDDTIFDVLERIKNIEFIFVGMEFHDLHPGHLYQLRVRGLNVAGVGPWSDPTLTTSTLPTKPCAPPQPTILTASLRSLVFQWSPPIDDGGTAITGYRIYLKNIDKVIDLPRSSVTYTWDSLFPGKSYYMKVLAKNEVGESEYSEFNDESQSFTIVAAPEKPSNPIATDGSWHSVTYEVDIPYHNGAVVKIMEVFQRVVEPFSISEWVRVPGTSNDPTTFKINNKKDVEIVKYVDLDKQQEDLEIMVRNLEILKAKSAFDMQKKHNSADEDIERLINGQKPSGSRIRFVVDNLSPDTLYEIRVRFGNAAGMSEFSQPSHRAKTNKASLPGSCAPPISIATAVDSILVEVTLPQTEGGSPITLVIVEAMDLDQNATTTFQFHRNELDTEYVVQYRLNKLRPGGSFVFRARAESAVGTGPFSDWSEEINLLSPENEPAVK